MLLALLLVLKATAFSGAPANRCESNSDCVLVKDTYCQQLVAISIGQDQKWADWEKRLYQEAKLSKRKCPLLEKQDPRLYDAICRSKNCEVIRKKSSG